MDVRIRAAIGGDVPEITAIHNSMLRSATIEWTEQPLDIVERQEWLRRQDDDGHAVLVAVSPVDRIVGWAAYEDFCGARGRPGYRHTMELTVHVHEDWRGRGVGRLLLAALVEHAAAGGVHVLVAGVDGEDAAAIDFHQRMGFEVVGRMPEVGRMHGRWLDLVLLQRILYEPDPVGG